MTSGSHLLPRVLRLLLLPLPLPALIHPDGHWLFDVGLWATPVDVGRPSFPPRAVPTSLSVYRICEPEQTAKSSGQPQALMGLMVGVREQA